MKYELFLFRALKPMVITIGDINNKGRENARYFIPILRYGLAFGFSEVICLFSLSNSIIYGCVLE